MITVTGRGLNPLALEWTDFGDPGLEKSQDVHYVYASGTVMQIVAPRRKLTAAAVAVPFRVRTLAGLSAPASVRYAGRPTITSVVNTADARNLKGVYGGPDTGGTPIAIHGHGLGSQVLGLEYTAPNARNSVGTQYTVHPHGGTRLGARTTAQNPAIVTVRPCTVTGCTPRGAHNRFWLYPPGDPTVTTLSPTDGPAAGGTAVTVVGRNLGCALAVEFGATRRHVGHSGEVQSPVRVDRRPVGDDAPRRGRPLGAGDRDDRRELLHRRHAGLDRPLQLPLIAPAGSGPRPEAADLAHQQQRRHAEQVDPAAAPQRRRGAQRPGERTDRNLPRDPAARAIRTSRRR